MMSKKEIGVRLAETMLMAELFGKTDDELKSEAKRISKISADEPIHITDLRLTHRYYCISKELNRRGYNMPVFDFFKDVEAREQQLQSK